MTSFCLVVFVREIGILDCQIIVSLRWKSRLHSQFVLPFNQDNLVEIYHLRLPWMKITLQIVEIFLEFRNLLFWKAVVLRLLIVCNLRFVIFILLFLCCHFRPRLWPRSLSLFVFQTLYFFLILIDIDIHLLFIIISSSFLALQLTRWLYPCIFWNASLLLIHTLLFDVRLIKLVWHDL